MDLALRIAGVLLAALLLGAGAAWLAITLLPCAWFGSGFEGACGYGAMWTALAIGLGVTLLAAVAGLWWVLSAARGASAGSAADAPAGRGLVAAWAASLALVLLARALLPRLGLGSLVDLPLLLALTLLPMGLSMVLARRGGRPAALGLLALLPWVGIVAVAVALAPTALAAWRRAPAAEARP